MADSLRNLWLLALLALFWGSSNPLIKMAVETIGPATVAAGRIATGCLAFVIIAAARGLPLLATARSARAWRDMAPIAVLAYVFPPLLIAYGQRHIDSGLTAITGGLVPIFTAFLSFAVYRRERFEIWTGAGIAIGFAGLIMLLGMASFGETRELAGLVAVAGGAFSYAWSNMAMARASPHDPIVSSALVLAAASAVLVPFAVAMDAPWPVVPSDLSLAATLALGLITTGCGSYVFFVLAARTGPIYLSTVNYLTPVVGVALGAAALGETLAWSAFGALACILAGVAATTYGRARAKSLKP